jgi:hypothetical protein
MIVVCPPLIITPAQMDHLVSVLDEALETVAAELSILPSGREPVLSLSKESG